MNARAWSGAALCVVLAACGGAHGGIPPVSRPPIGSATAAPPAKSASAMLKIIVPHASANAASRRPAYVSPSSATLLVAVNGGTASSYGLTAVSPGCTVVQSQTQCLLQIPAAPGNDSLSLTIEDGAGRVLSKNTVNATIAAGVSTPVNVTLAGIPTAVAIVPGSGSTIEDTATPAWHVPGLLPQAVEVEPLDADGNVIVGPGAPVLGTPSVSAGSAYAKIVSAQTSDPNAYLLEATSGAAGGQTVTVSASSQSITLSDGSQSAPVTSSTNFLYTPAVAIVSGNVVNLFSVETGTLLDRFSACGTGCSGGLTFARALTTDPNGDLFVETVSSLGLSLTDVVYVFPAGSLGVSTAYGPNSGVTGSGGIAADANRTLYVANGVSYTGSFPHRHEVPASLSAFTWGATAPTTSFTDATPAYLTGPLNTAIDSHGQLYIVNQDDSIDVYPAGFSSIVPSAVLSASGVSQPAGIAVDAHGGIYLFDTGNSDIAYFAPGATTVTSTISDPNGTFLNADGSIWFDGNGNLNVSLGNADQTEILSGSALASGQVTYLGSYASSGEGGWIP